MAERDPLINSFLAGNGWDGADRNPLPGDASFRRYERLALGERQAMLMDAPPPQENVDAFVAVARHLKSLGFSAPDIFAKDKVNGFLIIEDLGDETFTRLLPPLSGPSSGGTGDVSEEALYQLGVDVLIHLHGIEEEKVLPPGLEDYDEEKLLEEAVLLMDWTWPAVFGDNANGKVRNAYIDAWRSVFAEINGQPRTLVLRDYHVDNLMNLAGRQGIARCGLLDFQDAVRGPKAYDLMSLLEDARRDIGNSLKESMLARYTAAFPDLDRDRFMTDFTILAAQRHTKVIGIFTRLSMRDAKPAYLAHIPRVWKLLEQALTHQALTPVAAWFDDHFSPNKRGAPSVPEKTA